MNKHTCKLSACIDKSVRVSQCIDSVLAQDSNSPWIEEPFAT